jgi:hypothetical protein
MNSNWYLIPVFLQNKKHMPDVCTHLTKLENVIINTWVSAAVTDVSVNDDDQTEDSWGSHETRKLCN